jgi:WD domain, G-beta repeat
VATAFDRTGVSLRDVESGRLLTQLDTEREVRALSFSGDGSLLVTAGHGGARLWDTGRGVLLAVFAEHASLRSVAISPDGTRLATAGESAHAMVWPIALKALSPTEIRRLLACYVPWFLQNGALVSRASTPAECSVGPAAAPKPSRTPGGSNATEAPVAGR